jgi:hypothetical protein
MNVESFCYLRHLYISSYTHHFPFVAELSIIHDFCIFPMLRDVHFLLKSFTPTNDLHFSLQSQIIINYQKF